MDTVSWPVDAPCPADGTPRPPSESRTALKALPLYTSSISCAIRGTDTDDLSAPRDGYVCVGLPPLFIGYPGPSAWPAHSAGHGTSTGPWRHLYLGWKGLGHGKHASPASASGTWASALTMSGGSRQRRCQWSCDRTSVPCALGSSGHCSTYMKVISASTSPGPLSGMRELPVRGAPVSILVSGHTAAAAAHLQSPLAASPS